MATEAHKMVNGVDVTALAQIAADFGQDAELGAFRFRVSNRWLDGGRNQSTVTKFFGAKQEQDDRRFTLHADEPALLLGQDTAPNPVEHLLHALASCLTSAMVYHAAARGIVIEQCETELEGELDARGFLGLSDDVRKGYQRISVRFEVHSDGAADVLEQCARFSPVLDVVSNGTRVDLRVEKATSPRVEAAGESRAPAQP